MERKEKFKRQHNDYISITDIAKYKSDEPNDVSGGDKTYGEEKE